MALKLNVVNYEFINYEWLKSSSESRRDIAKHLNGQGLCYGLKRKRLDPRSPELNWAWICASLKRRMLFLAPAALPAAVANITNCSSYLEWGKWVWVRSSARSQLVVKICKNDTLEPEPYWLEVWTFVHIIWCTSTWCMVSISVTNYKFDYDSWIRLWLTSIFQTYSRLLLIDIRSSRLS